MDAKSKRCQFFKRLSRLEISLRCERTASLFVTKRMSPWNKRTSWRDHPTSYLSWMPKQLSLDSWSNWRWFQLQIIIHPYIRKIKRYIYLLKQLHFMIQRLSFFFHTTIFDYSLGIINGLNIWIDYRHFICNLSQISISIQQGYDKIYLVKTTTVYDLYGILQTNFTIILFLRNIL